MKVAQVTASTLGVPLSSVTVVPTNTFTSPNNTTTGGSVTSEINCKVCSFTIMSRKYIIILPLCITFDIFAISVGQNLTVFLFLQSALLACQSLKKRFDNVKEGMIADGVSDPSWLQIVQKAFSSGIDLSEKH